MISEYLCRLFQRVCFKQQVLVELRLHGDFADYLLAMGKGVGAAVRALSLSLSVHFLYSVMT